MSDIGNVFEHSRVEFGLKQKPNWSGTVYGCCMNKGCGNCKHIGYYVGGFCKLCSQRYPEDKKKPVLSAPNAPNPAIHWTQKSWVKDMSHTMSVVDRRDFYETPDQTEKKLDKVMDIIEEMEE